MQKNKVSLAFVIVLLTLTASPKEAKAQVLEGALIGAGVGAVVGIIVHFTRKKPAEKIEGPTLNNAPSESKASSDFSATARDPVESIKNQLQGENQKEERKPLLQSEKAYGIRYQSGDSSALSVAQSFLENLKKERFLGGYQILDFVYHSDDLQYLKSGFPRGYVFDFKNLKKDPSINVRVRLIQFPEAKILWEETCRSSDLETCSQNLIDRYPRMESVHSHGPSSPHTPVR